MLLGSMRSRVVRLAARPSRIGRCERRGWLQPGFGEKALREGRQTAIGQVEFNTLNAVHGKENDRGSEGLAVSHHHGEIFKGGEFGPTQTEALGRKRQDHPPELLARIAQRHNHHCAGQKWLARPGRRSLTAAG